MFAKGSRRTKKLFSLALSLMFSVGVVGNAPAFSQDGSKLRVPTKVPTPRAKEAPHYAPDVLLVMPNASSEKDELDKSLKEVHGTVIGSMGEGRLKCLIIRTEKGKLEETEKKLVKDKKHFNCISKNYQFKAQLIPNDAQFVNEWHLSAINCPRAWDGTTGGGTKIAVFDSGCQASNPDLAGKTQKGYDATTFGARLTVLGGPGLGDLLGGLGGALSSGAQTDVQGHGTLVATTAAARHNNTVMTAGVAPSATVYPVQIAGSNGMTDDIAIMAGLLNMMASGNRIVNISYGAYPGIGFTNAALHAPLHMYFHEFHDIKGGLIFISSGNDGAFDPFPMVPYLNVVSAIDNSFQLAEFSNWGMSTTFTAPGKDIVCSDRSGNVVTVDGTSFSAPIVASVAALVWNANPALPNTWVEHILKLSCFRAGGAAWTPYYGFGMPNAERAVRIARGG